MSVDGIPPNTTGAALESVHIAISRRFPTAKTFTLTSGGVGYNFLLQESAAVRSVIGEHWERLEHAETKAKHTPNQERMATEALEMRLHTARASRNTEYSIEQWQNRLRNEIRESVGPQVIDQHFPPSSLAMAQHSARSPFKLCDMVTLSSTSPTLRICDSPCRRSRR